MKKNLLILLLTFLSNQYLIAQSFINGSFETTTSTSCDYNNTIGEFNAVMSNVVMFAGTEVDIQEEGCLVTNLPDGAKVVGLAAQDAINIELTAPLTSGVDYTLTFMKHANSYAGVYGDLEIGATTDATTMGTIIQTVPPGVQDTWIQETFTFTAPNNTTHISIRNAVSGYWNQIDNFSFGAVVNTAPTAVCQDFTAQLDAMGSVTITGANVDGGSTDPDMDMLTLTVSPDTFDCSAVGTPQTVTLTVDDGNGGTDSCTATVTVEDNIPPAITCPGDIIVSNDASTCGAVVTFTEPTATDNCGNAMATQTFDFTGTTQTFTVPLGVTNITIEAYGGAGQDFTVEQYQPSTGGLGGFASGELNVTPGDILTIYVGGAGIDGAGGFNGGGTGGFGTPTDGSAGFAGSGGGASDVRIGAGTLADRVIVAGGGGGGGRDYVNGSCQPCGTGGAGGAGGALVGVNGMGGGPGTSPTGPYPNPNAGGFGGDQTMGGAGGGGVGPTGNAGTLGDGGMGLNGQYSTASGGAGGGYYGGGSGGGTNPGGGQAGGGGAGGSSYIDGVTNGSTTAGLRSGDGQIVITYETLSLMQTAGLPSGSTFPIGTTTNTFVVTDGSGNTATCSFDVTVNDTEDPMITCPADIMVNNDPGMCAAIVDFMATATDNCSAVVTYSQDPLTSFPVGTTTVTATATDPAGNTATCTFDVTVTDTEPPVAVCMDFTVQLDAAGNGSIVAADVDGGSSDNCGIASLSVSPSTFTCADVGANTVTLTVTDVNGNSSMCTATVTVEDNVPPVAVCMDITVQLDAAGNATIVPADVDGGSSDACGIATTTIDINTFDCSDVGTNNVTLTITDVNGNSSSCIAVVTVEDNVPPLMNCPADFTVGTDTGVCGATVSFADPIPVDACGIASVVQTAGLPSGSIFPVGPNVVEYTTTDINGNTTTCNFTITVVDDETPTAVCMDITIQLDAAGNATIVPADVDGGSTDNCAVDFLSIDINSFTCADVGPNNVVLTVTDTAGLMSSCTAIVTVEDITPPTVVCQDITVTLDALGIVTIDPSLLDGGSTDACGTGNFTYTATPDTFTCAELGPNTVTLTVTDENGNSATCEAIVTVIDVTAPVLVCQDITVQLDENGLVSILPGDVIASVDDACGIHATGLDIDDFSCDDIGTPVVVNVFANDASNNIVTCTATVTVVDLLAPTITCPVDQIVSVNNGAQYELPDYFADGLAIATDNCTDPVTIISQTPAAGSLLDPGVYTVTFTAEDAFGNIGTCEFELTVEEILGVNDASLNLSTLTLYPNPASDFIKLSNPKNIPLKEVSIYDVTGRLIKVLDASQVISEMTIDISELASATYVVLINTEAGQVTKQLVKE